MKRLLVATAIALSFSMVTTGEAFAFTFTKIADSNDAFSSFGTYPVINNQGTVAFSADLNAGGSGIFVGNGQETATIADTNSPLSLLRNPSAINDAGVVAFKAGLDAGGGGIFTSNGTEITTITTSPRLASLGDPVVNNNGTVAFASILERGERAILRYEGGTTTPVTDTRVPYSLFDGYGMNDIGTVAFAASIDAAGIRGIYLRQGEITTLIADTNGLYSFFYPPAINNSNTVAFKGVLQALAGEGIFTVSNGVTTTIADNNGLFDFFENPAINDRGTVAFKAVLKAGGLGIFTGGDPVKDKVITTGDTLLGAKVTDLYFSPQGLNNANQFTFFAKLDNGTSGIFRADWGDGPTSGCGSSASKCGTSVPEPTSVLGLLILGALGAVFRLKDALSNSPF